MTDLATRHSTMRDPSGDERERREDDMTVRHMWLGA